MIVEQATSPVQGSSDAITPHGGNARPFDPLSETTELGTVPMRRARDINRVNLPFLRIQERRLLLVVGDAMIAASSTLVAYDIWRIAVHPVGHNLTSVPWPWVISATVSWLTISWLAGAYDLDVADRAAKAASRTLAVGAVALVEALLFYWLFLKSYPRPSLALALVGIVAATIIWRVVYARALGRTGATRTLFLGDQPAFASLAAVTDACPDRYKLVAHVTPDMVMESDFDSVHDSLLDLIERRRVHRIVVGPRNRLTDEVVASLIGAIEKGVEVFDFNTAYEEVSGKVAVEHVGRQWLAALPTRPNSGAYEEGAMRLLDIVGAIVGLLVTAIIFIPIGIGILIAAPGPILYSQTRVGRGGKTFTIYKFRSMRTDAEQTGVAWAVQNDPRVTRFGRFLRSTHIDELPQCWNVFIGDMSLVGPRPERPEFTDLLSARIPFYRLRISVRPGMTGLKQIKFGYASTEDEHLEVLRHDLYYIKHRSLLMNLSLIAQTLAMPIRSRRAI
jgi:exopolysaccharide biosynthesis polyprenyl glycosylphosphotransferase